MATHRWENSMSVACGDLNADGFADVLVGTGTPDWGHYDFSLCNQGNNSNGWQGLARCQHGDSRVGLFGSSGDTRTHGFAFGDLDGDGAQEVVVATGGFALADQSMPDTLSSMVQDCEGCHMECSAGSLTFRKTWLTSRTVTDFQKQLGQRAVQANCSWPLPCPLQGHEAKIICDSRSGVLLYALPSDLARVAKQRVAQLRLQGLGGPSGSGRDAIGARVEVFDGAWRRHYVVRSAQGFNSQDSAWLPVVVGPRGAAKLNIQWPSGQNTAMRISAGERKTILEGR